MVKTIVIMTVLVILMGVFSYVLGFKEWLKWAVLEAEKQYGSGTGSVKLHAVYDWAILRFPWIAKLMPFSLFSKLVDLALKWMQEQIEKNINIANLIKPESEE